MSQMPKPGRVRAADVATSITACLSALLSVWTWFISTASLALFSLLWQLDSTSEVQVTSDSVAKL